MPDWTNEVFLIDDKGYIPKYDLGIMNKSYLESISDNDDSVWEILGYEVRKITYIINPVSVLLYADCKSCIGFYLKSNYEYYFMLFKTSDDEYFGVQDYTGLFQSYARQSSVLNYPQIQGMSKDGLSFLDTFNFINL